MEWKSWSSLSLIQRANLPDQPGIYVVVDVAEQVWYVGKSTNIKHRWNGKGHHRYQQLSRTNSKKSYQIYWQIFPSDQLSEQEQKYIILFKPHLNYSRVKTYPRKAIQPNQEISRLLKVLNQKTILFPVVRSVVLGFYNDVGEDEDGILKEYTCIVIAVNLNDYDGVILKAYGKSFTRKGQHLKDSWKFFECDCGDADSTLKPASIPVFVLEDIVYEFVCFPDMIFKLEQDTQNLFNLKLADQYILALWDLSTLSSLVGGSKSYSLRSEEYLRYRIPVLKLITNLVSGAANS